MNKKFLMASFDLGMNWEGHSPSFRVYVNRELFCERKFIWGNDIITVSLQIEAVPGSYPVEIESIRNTNAKLSVTNHRIKVGSGQWLGANKIEIL